MLCRVSGMGDMSSSSKFSSVSSPAASRSCSDSVRGQSKDSSISNEFVLAAGSSHKLNLERLVLAGRGV